MSALSSFFATERKKDAEDTLHASGSSPDSILTKNGFLRNTCLSGSTLSHTETKTSITTPYGFAVRLVSLPEEQKALSLRPHASAFSHFISSASSEKKSRINACVSHPSFPYINTKTSQV
jgi:hypothetical protein